MEHGGTQEKVMITCDDDQVLNLEKRKEKNKNPRRSRERYKIGFYFALKTS
jgi:hypothetical protein